MKRKKKRQEPQINRPSSGFQIYWEHHPLYGTIRHYITGSGRGPARGTSK